jgi:hypothetical protein
LSVATVALQFVWLDGRILEADDERAALADHRESALGRYIHLHVLKSDSVVFDERRTYALYSGAASSARCFD